jgi:hypothetical protein
VAGKRRPQIVLVGHRVLRGRLTGLPALPVSPLAFELGLPLLLALFLLRSLAFELVLLLGLPAFVLRLSAFELVLLVSLPAFLVRLSAFELRLL